MKKISKKQKVKNYILESIDDSGYSVAPTIEREKMTEREKVEFLRNCFYSELGWRVEQIGEHKSITEWLGGLPSSINIAFMNHEIIALLTKWEILPLNSTDAVIDRMLGYWFSSIAQNIGELFRKHKLGD
jgi:hypothetical protein